MDDDLGEALRLWEGVLNGLEAAGADSSGLAADLAEYGIALEGSGRHSDALSALRRSLALRPFDSGTLSAAARAARAVGETVGAERYEARALLTAPSCR